MGFWRTFGQEMRGILMLPETANFAAEEPYQPIAQLLYSMTHSGSAAKVSRADALSVPAVMRGRNMICNVATLPLVTVNKQRKVVEREFLAQIDPDVPNEVTLAQTLEDLFFEGTSYWLITEFDFDGMPLHARHLAWETVTLQPPGNGRSPAPLPSGIDPRGATPYVDGRPVSWSQLIMFSSLNPPLLSAAARPIRRALLLDKMANMYAENPRPLDYFTPGEGADPADDDEIRVMLANWQQARQNGSTAYIPAALKYTEVTVPTPADMQIVEQQVQVDRQLSNAMGIDAVDVGVSTTSDTYQNAVDRRQDKVNTVLAAYIKAITSRLSMDDVTRPGERVDFDLDNYLRADPKTRAEIADIRLRNGTKTIEEDREDENMPDLPAARLKPAEVGNGTA